MAMQPSTTTMAPPGGRNSRSASISRSHKGSCDITKVVIIPENGSATIDAYWYDWAINKLKDFPNYSPNIKQMPDPVMSRESFWIPFMKGNLHCDENTIIIGHDVGAAAALRFAEKYKLKGMILISPHSDDLDDQDYKSTGFYSRPWNWDAINKHVTFIIQFGSMDNEKIPWEEQNRISRLLKADLKQYNNRGNFQDNTFPELIQLFETERF